MKTKLITALSVIAVLGTAGTAMAVNSDTLSFAPTSEIGDATEVLVPTVEDGTTPTPTAITPSPSATDDSTHDDSDDDSTVGSDDDSDDTYDDSDDSSDDDSDDEDEHEDEDSEDDEGDDD